MFFVCLFVCWKPAAYSYQIHWRARDQDNFSTQSMLLKPLTWNICSALKWKLLSHVTLQPHGLYSPWISPGQNTGVGSVSLLQGIFPTQGWNPGLPHAGRFFTTEPPTSNLLYPKNVVRHVWASLVAQAVKNPPAMQEIQVRSLCWEDPLEGGMATHSSILAWRNSRDGTTWWATVQGARKSGARLNDQHFTFTFKNIV